MDAVEYVNWIVDGLRKEGKLPEPKRGIADLIIVDWLKSDMFYRIDPRFTISERPLMLFSPEQFAKLEETLLFNRSDMPLEERKQFIADYSERWWQNQIGGT